MKKRTLIVAAFCCALLATGLISPAPGAAGVRLNIEVALPPIFFSAPPFVVVIPDTLVYYPPDVAVDIFFFNGYWYRPHRGHWFIASHFNGPWSLIAVGSVPGVVLKVPLTHHRVFRGHDGPRHGEFQKRWRTWERDGFWDRHERRGEFGDRGKGKRRGHGGGGKRGWNDD
jgi:hypothetical protein